MRLHLVFVVVVVVLAWVIAWNQCLVMCLWERSHHSHISTVLHEEIKITAQVEQQRPSPTACNTTTLLQENSVTNKHGLGADCEANQFFIDRQQREGWVIADMNNACPMPMTCDDPLVRNSYAKAATRHLTIVWYVFVNFGEELFYNDAEIKIAGTMATMRDHYRDSGLTFSSILKKLTLIVDKEPVVNFAVASTCGNAANGQMACFTAEEVLQAANGATQKGWEPPATIHIVATRLQNIGINGFAYYPFDPNGVLGAVVVASSAVGEGFSTVSHEVGHALGLYHVFHGISEMGCTDPCRETMDADGDRVGDFCSDTVPEPASNLCDALPSYSAYPDTCDSTRGSWTLINFNNIMGYAKEQTCRKVFTTQQIWRMRCVADRYYHAPMATTSSHPLDPNDNDGQSRPYNPPPEPKPEPEPEPTAPPRNPDDGDNDEDEDDDDEFEVLPVDDDDGSRHGSSSSTSNVGSRSFPVDDILTSLCRLVVVVMMVITSFQLFFPVQQ